MVQLDGHFLVFFSMVHLLFPTSIENPKIQQQDTTPSKIGGFYIHKRHTGSDLSTWVLYYRKDLFDDFDIKPENIPLGRILPELGKV